MSKTTATLVAALALLVASISLAAVRRHALGPELDGPREAGAWRVTLTATGRLADRKGSVSLFLPRDFRRQHIYQERFRSKELIHQVPRRKIGATRRALWRPRDAAANQDIRFTYAFSCLIPVLQPQPGMIKLTELLDAAPQGPVRADMPESKEIARAARNLLHEGMSPADKVRACYDFVSELGNGPAQEEQSSRETLRAGAGDCGGKSRLLVDLCRAMGIHARLVSGLVLSEDNPSPDMHYWAEAWVRDHWLPMDPTLFHYGSEDFPANYFVLQLGNRKLIRAEGTSFKVAFHVEHLANTSDADNAHSPALRRFWQRLSLHGLRPAEQNLVRILLLLPLAGLIVAIFRTVIGVPTFGTFSPALLGLAFLDTKSLRWGLPIFTLLVLAGWGMRHLLERFHLLQVPRISALLTLIVILLLLIIVAAGNLGIATTQYISLFPLVILTHLVERFWTIEAEDGSASSFRTLLGTIVVAVTVSLILGQEIITTWMFRHPETLGVTLAFLLVLGRYTGYRIAELYRFGDLLAETPAHVEAGALSHPNGDEGSRTQETATRETGVKGT